MTDEQSGADGFVVAAEQPLIAVPLEEDGRDIVRYFTDEERAADAARSRSGRRAVDLAGVWSDLDWDEMADALDRIRHESKPTPPFEL